MGSGVQTIQKPFEKPNIWLSDYTEKNLKTQRYFLLLENSLATGYPLNNRCKELKIRLADKKHGTLTICEISDLSEFVFIKT
jgi:hypothetical protein